MINEQNIEQIYDLLEQFDFEQLTESQKKLVLTEMTCEEYQAMRSTIAGTKSFFDKHTTKVFDTKHFNLNKILTFPVQFYKVAAAVLILINLSFMLGRLSNTTSQNIIAKADTIFVEKIDTIFAVQRDTLRIIKQVSSKIPLQLISQHINVGNHIELENGKPRFDCSQVICPEDIETINSHKSENNFSNDSILKEFIVSLY